jgi:hypothetical protein
MPSAVRQLTSVGGDIRQIARLLQKKAPPGHMLAYINQEEADLLKARGGSGKPHADTGVPSFQDTNEGEFEATLQGPPEPPQGPPESAANPKEVASTPGSVTSDFSDAYNAPASMPSGGAGAPTATPGTPPPATPTLTTQLEPRDLDLLGKLKSATGLGDESLKKLGIGGLQGLAGSLMANKAQQAGQQGKEELSALAAPYRQQGSDIIAKAQRGELTPVGQQQLQAVQAQAAQGAEKRGGVGAQQSMAQVEAFRQQLLQQQYDYGLKLSGIADNIAMGAIKTGLQADQYVSKLTTDYFGNIARVMAGIEDKKPAVGE